MRFWLSVLLAACACGPSALQLQVRAANAAAMAVDAALPAVAAAYRRAGDDAIAAAASPSEAEALLGRVRAKWRPVWGVCDDAAAGPERRCHDGAWPALVDAQGRWDDLLERTAAGAPLDAAAVRQAAAALRAAYCDLLMVLPAAAAAALGGLDACPTSASAGGP
jgi:hypothetical protein